MQIKIGGDDAGVAEGLFLDPSKRVLSLTFGPYPTAKATGTVRASSRAHHIVSCQMIVFLWK